MSVKEIINIDDHVARAISRLPQKHKAIPSGNWDSLLTIFVNPAQDLEDIMQDVLDNRSLTAAVGVNLARMGTWVGENRLGRIDADYLVGIYGKIAENNSDTTEKDVMLSVKRFAEAEDYIYVDATNGKFNITLYNPVYPVEPRLYTSVDSAKAAGVGYPEFTMANLDYFGFTNDVNAKGFGTYIPTMYPFYFVDEVLSPSEEVGVYENGGDYTLKLAMKDGSDAFTTETQLQVDFDDSTKPFSDGNIRIIDAEGVVWDVECLGSAPLTVNATPSTLESNITPPFGYSKLVPVGEDTHLYGFLASADALVYQILAAVETYTPGLKVVAKLWSWETSTAILISTSNEITLTSGVNSLTFVFDPAIKYVSGERILFSVHLTEGVGDAYLFHASSASDVGVYGEVNEVTGTHYSTPFLLPEDNYYYSVCWSPELTLFVAVASSGTGTRVMTSPDGAVWTSRTNSVDNQWQSVCWSPALTLFVAVSYDGTGDGVMTSPDGINWTTRTSAADYQWLSVCWSPELTLFVAVASTGTGDRVMTSPDGINWTSRTSAADNHWRSVCWSPELTLFVAVSDNGSPTQVMTSPDGINWTSQNSASVNAWASVCWSPELTLFVAVAYSGTNNRAMTSPDGINWTSRTSAANNYWQSVCWSPELTLFVAVAYTGINDRVMTSPDGTNWTSRDAVEEHMWMAVCWSPELNRFCAVSIMMGLTDRTMTSSNGIDWVNGLTYGGPATRWDSILADDETRVMEIALTSSSGATELCEVSKNGSVVSMAEFLSTFSKLDKSMLTTADLEWVVRSYTGNESQAGNFSTLLPRS